MDLVPVRTMDHISVEGKVIIKVPKFASRFYHIIAPFTAKLYFNINLDDMGSTVWQTIDGRRNVQEICNVMRDRKNSDNTDLVNLDERLSEYMMLLYERRFISFKQILKN